MLGLFNENSIPFGVHADTGELTFVDEVSNGLSCNCICIFCRMPLVAVANVVVSNFVKPHFKHAPRSTSNDHKCEYNFERAMFWLCKNILQQSKCIVLPEVTLGNAFGKSGKAHFYSQITFPSASESFGTQLCELIVDGLKVCLYLARPSEFNYGVGQSVLLVDIEQLKALLTSTSLQLRKATEQFLIYEFANKKWVSHPMQTDLRRAEHQRIAMQVKQDGLNSAIHCYDSIVRKPPAEMLQVEATKAGLRNENKPKKSLSTYLRCNYCEMVFSVPSVLVVQCNYSVECPKCQWPVDATIKVGFKCNL